MRLKPIVALLLTGAFFIVPHTLDASDFEWRHPLNLRANTDPYGYRYGLIQRFGMSESDVVHILNRVYEPADAYMVFRFAELSGYSPEYVLRIYHERRPYGWSDIAHFLGIHVDAHDFTVFRERHDMREVYYVYNDKRKERYEERYRPPVQHHYVPPKKHYAPPQTHHKPHRHEQPRPPSPPVPNQSKPHSYEKQYEPKQHAMAQYAKPQHHHARGNEKRGYH